MLLPNFKKTALNLTLVPLIWDDIPLINHQQNKSVCSKVIQGFG